VTRKLLVLVAVAVLAVMAVWYEAWYRPEASHIKALQVKQQAAQVSLEQLEIRYAALLSSKKKVPAEQKVLKQLQHLVPDGPGLDNIITTLYAAAAAAGTELTSIQSPAPSGFGPGSASVSSGSGPSQLSLTIAVGGTLGQVKDLVRVLESEPRLFVVDTFTLPSGNSGKGGSTMSLRAFYASANSDTAAS